MNKVWLYRSILIVGLVVFFMAGLFAVLPRPLPTAAGVAGTPWWAPLGGVTGAVAVVVELMFVDKIGAGPFDGLVITANILASLAIDNWGLLKMPTHASVSGARWADC